MGQQLNPPEPVRLVMPMLSASAEMFALAEMGMQQVWGEIDVRSEVMPFDLTAYYEKEMGPNLVRKLVSFTDLIAPGQLAQIKHISNALEVEYAHSELGLSLQVPRPINLDPGYLELNKLVLATTKNRSHRIYLGENMYAEATLHYHRGHWCGWPYTYPDYAGGAYESFFNQVRRRLMEQLSSLKENT